MTEEHNTWMLPIQQLQAVRIYCNTTRSVFWVRDEKRKWRNTTTKVRMKKQTFCTNSAKLTFSHLFWLVLVWPPCPGLKIGCGFADILFRVHLRHEKQYYIYQAGGTGRWLLLLYVLFETNVCTRLTAIVQFARVAGAFTPLARSRPPTFRSLRSFLP